MSYIWISLLLIMNILKTIHGEDRVPGGTESNDTTVAVTNPTVLDPGGGSVRHNSSTKEILKLGLVFPYSSQRMNVNFRARDYAAAFKIAVDRVNNDRALLPNHEINFVYNDTNFQESKSIKAIYEQLNKHNVSAFVGFGWSCHSAALIATAVNVPIISYVGIIITPSLIRLHYICHMFFTEAVLNFLCMYFYCMLQSIGFKTLKSWV